MHIRLATTFRISFTAAALVAALAANAQVITLISVGSALESAPNVNFTESVIYDTAAPLTSLTYHVGLASGAGAGVYTNGTGNTLDFNFAFSPASYSAFGNSGSYDGVWTYTGGTGAFAGKTGGGTLDLNYYVTGATSASTATTLSGLLTAVPEPASYAVVGVGMVGLLIRRRKI